MSRFMVVGYTAGPPTMFCVIDTAHPLKREAPWYSPIISGSPFRSEDAAQDFADACNASPPPDVRATPVRDKDGTVIRIERI